MSSIKLGVMLTIVRVQSGLDRRELLEKFDGQSATWVVSDVRSKLAIQKRLLQQNGFASGPSVLRASEVWTQFLKRLKPDLQIVSRELALASIAELLSKRPEPWLQSPGASKTAFEYVRQLLPLLAANSIDGTTAALVGDWFSQEEHEASKSRWKIWFDVAEEIWTGLLKQNLCAASWVAGILVASREQLTELSDRNYVIDLGAELSHVEAELLLSIAKERHVTVLRPAPHWEADYPEGRLAADWLTKNAESRGVPFSIVDATAKGSGAQNIAPIPTTFVYKRLPSASAEIKEAVARVREWLEQGVPETQIAIAAPDLEAYWPVLSLHLEVEGISTSKAVVSALHSFPDMMKWLARLRVRSGIPDSRDLEMDVFGDLQPTMTFSGFREIFSRVYEVEDLDLSPDVLKHFKTEFSDTGRWQDEAIDRDQFLARAVSLLRLTDEVSRAIRALKAVLEECPPDLKFKTPQWVKYLSEAIAKVEVAVIPADPRGIWCLNLGSLEGVECTHLVVMGLHEGALRSQHGTAVQTTDLRGIERDLGFVIDGEDRKRTEFEARWILSQPRTITHLLFSDTDLNGTVQTPSWTWISGAWSEQKKTPEIEVPLPTRFDQQMSRPFITLGSEAQRTRLKFERGETGVTELKSFAADLVTSLSATTIDQVSKCPLQFAFRRILGPRDQGELDLDADSSRQGRLQHKVFEYLGNAQWSSMSDSEIIEVVEKAKVDVEAMDKKPLVRSPQAWFSLRRRVAKVARWVLEFEREQRRKFPDLKTVGCEVSFEGTIGTRGVKIRGQIDRVDSLADGRTIIVDYKNRSYTQNFAQWSKKNFWQPLVYAYAFENGWTKLAPGKLAAVFIYDISQRERGSGLRLRDGNEDLFEFTSRSKGQTRSDVDQSLGDLVDQVDKVVEILKAGHFRPEPSDPKECDRCQWAQACRAPHLELAT
ncbi:MAG: PD-(D/E)XK nuclease family protein [Bdellovibrionales bacterium]|nr:PD-(D/E)XK nuclease family protein [Bdellovibrionales bacterium]